MGEQDYHASTFCTANISWTSGDKNRKRTQCSPERGEWWMGILRTDLALSSKFPFGIRNIFFKLSH